MKALGLLPVLALLAGCGDDGDDQAPETAADSAAAAEAAAPTMTEPQLVMTVLVADAADSAAGAIAVQRADAASVRSFAQSMVWDHASVNEQLSTLSAQLNLVPTESSVSAQLRSRGEQTLAQLQSTLPSAFDSAYLAAEVASHTLFLNALDTHVVPSAQNPDLKVTVQNIRRAIAVHLAVAQRLQAEQRQRASTAAAPPRSTTTTAPASADPSPPPVRPTDTTTRVLQPPVDTARREPPVRIDSVRPPPVTDSLRSGSRR